MSNSTCVVVLNGNIGADPEWRVTPAGKGIAKVNLAINSFSKNPETGDFDKETDWHTVKFLGPLAERVKDRARKGTKLCVTGTLKIEKWVDRDTGKNCQRTVILANTCEIASGEATQVATQPQAAASQTPRSRLEPSQELEVTPPPSPRDRAMDAMQFDDDVSFGAESQMPNAAPQSNPARRAGY